MNSLWNMDDSLVLAVSFTGYNNRFLITHWFTTMSMSMFRTEQIQSVFLHYFASGRSETQEKCTAFVEMSCSTS